MSLCIRQNSLSSAPVHIYCSLREFFLYNKNCTKFFVIVNDRQFEVNMGICEGSSQIAVTFFFFGKEFSFRNIEIA